MTLNNTLVAWYGLPGSGKSTHLDRYRSYGYLVFDDFMKNAIDNNPAFSYSRHFEDIVTALHRSRPCVIADIRLCEREYRQDVARILGERVPHLSIEWHCFDCRTLKAVETCQDNVRYRAETTRRGEEHALRSIGEFSPRFSVEKGARVYRVVHARTGNSK